MTKDIEKLIDKLYKTYCEELPFVTCNSIHSSQLDCVELENYAKDMSKSISNTYSSIQEDNNEKDYIDNIVSILEEVAMYVDDWLDYTVGGSHTFITANDLLDFNLNTVDFAFEKYNKYIPKNMYNKTINLLKFIKDKNSLKKVYGSNNWKNLSTKEILISLKDYHKNNEKLFNIGNDDNEAYIELGKDFDRNFGFFNTIKNNCDLNFNNFDKYRPCFISKKELNVKLDKLIFCKNILEYLKTDLFVEHGGYLNCKLDCQEEYVLESLRKTYSKSFKIDNFKKNQANVIFNPNMFENCEINYNKPTKFVKSRSLKSNTGLVMGLILKNEAEDMYYLIHISISDLTNNKGCYEIQLNVLPQGEIAKRIQLIRMDNYESSQAHKNIGGKKLVTTTHIHLYNHFDLLRGKQNGNFDISHNLETESTDFDSALQLFLGCMDLDENLYSDIINKVNEVKSRRINELKQKSLEKTI